MSALVTKLNRAAREPSRVFAQSDFRDLREPLWRLDGGWYGPANGSWFVRTEPDECTVLNRALEKWGKLDTGLNVDSFVSAPTEPVAIGEPELREVYNEKSLAPFCPVAGFDAPATPIYYAFRRFGTEGEWRLIAGMPVILYSVDGVPVVIVRLAKLTRETLHAEAA